MARIQVVDVAEREVFRAQAEREGCSLSEWLRRAGRRRGGLGGREGAARRAAAGPMIFVDTSVVMYAVGGAHPLRDPVRRRLRDTPLGVLATSAAVMRELLPAYLPVHRLADLDAAHQLVLDRMTVWPIDAAILTGARTLVARRPGSAARDLVQLAGSLTHEVTECWTYDRALAAAFTG